MKGDLNDEEPAMKTSKKNVPSKVKDRDKSPKNGLDLTHSENTKEKKQHGWCIENREESGMTGSQGGWQNGRPSRPCVEFGFFFLNHMGGYFLMGYDFTWFLLIYNCFAL